MSSPRTAAASVTIDEPLVHGLLVSQFPQWAELPIERVTPGGWDNMTFRLGDDLLVRVPRAAAYSEQVQKEHRWLPVLAHSLPLEIPTPVALGAPGCGLPWSWAVYRWIEGAAPSFDVADSPDFASSLARFLAALQRVDPSGGPPPGPHNFHRGGSLTTYDAEVRQALAVLGGKLDTRRATAVWEAALGTRWRHSAVWVHGDVAATNLLVRGERLRAVIDFGLMAVGDPACDLSIAWTLFRRKGRDAFRAMLPLDADAWIRGRAWTLWKAVIVASGLSPANAVDPSPALQVIDEVLLDKPGERPAPLRGAQ